MFGNNLFYENTETLSHRLQFLVNKPIIELDETDSTNNYAMRLIDADTALDGLTITALRQTNGKGQRGRKWQGDDGESLLMSVIVVPQLQIDQQFVLCAAAALAITDALNTLKVEGDIKIKWTNDIIINDKKTGGILIENILRGTNWNYAIIGIGLNILQQQFPIDLPLATSLKKETNVDYDLYILRDLVRNNIFKLLNTYTTDQIMELYNSQLYKRGDWQTFERNGQKLLMQINEVMPNGTLRVTDENGDEGFYMHGVENWVW